MRSVLLVLLWPIVVLAQDGIEPGDIRIELALEERDHAPYPGEMILLSIQGTYKIPVVRETLVEPTLPEFEWMQLGEDRWYKDYEDGFEVLKFERRMALFSLGPGQVDVPPFTHSLEMLGRNGRTVPIEVASNELVLDVAPLPEHDGWWFPVRDIDISDNWSNQPEALEAGGSALRIITLQVHGTAPQRIPPMPELTGAGVYVFPHPEHRIVKLGPQGPISTVFWRWTVRPREDSAGYLNPMGLRYFDAEMREMVDIRLAAQRVAYRDGPQAVVEDEGPAPVTVGVEDTGWALPTLPPLAAWTVPLFGMLAVLVGLFLVMRRAIAQGLSLPLWMRRDPQLTALSRAVRERAPERVRNLSHAILAERGGTVPEPLARLDRALYGVAGMLPDLREVARAVIRA